MGWEPRSWRSLRGHSGVQADGGAALGEGHERTPCWLSELGLREPRVASAQAASAKAVVHPAYLGRRGQCGHAVGPGRTRGDSAGQPSRPPQASAGRRPLRVDFYGSSLQRAQKKSMTRCVFHRWRNRASEKSNVCTEVCCLIRQESCIPEPDLRELTTHSPAHSALFPK